MKSSPFVVAASLLFVLTLSCSRDTTLTLSSTYDARVLVAQDKVVMERIIDCAVTRTCDRLPVMELLPSGNVFLVATGTKVMMRDSFSLSDVKKVRILDGEHSGKEGWVYERMLCEDQSSPADQLAFARLYHDR